MILVNNTNAPINATIQTIYNSVSSLSLVHNQNTGVIFNNHGGVRIPSTGNGLVYRVCGLQVVICSLNTLNNGRQLHFVVQPVSPVY